MNAWLQRLRQPWMGPALWVLGLGVPLVLDPAWVFIAYPAIAQITSVSGPQP